MATENMTPSQLDAVESEGAVLVSAAAGSGKTSVLTEKVVRLLTYGDNPCDADRLLVVTFTNAAAAEMRSRIEKRLNEECAKDPSNKRLLKQKILLAHSSVCTIDTFCMDLVRENFYDLRIDPGFNIINSAVFEDWKNAEAGDILSRRYVADPVGYKSLLDSQWSVFGDDHLKRCVIRLYEFTRALQDPDGWLDQVMADYEFEGGLNNNVWGKAAFQQAENLFEHVRCKAAYAINQLKKAFDGKDMPQIAINFCDVYLRNVATAEKGIAACCEGDWALVAELSEALEYFTLSGMKKLQESKDTAEVSAANIISNTQAELKDVRTDLLSLFYDTEENVIAHIRRDATAVRFLAESVKELASALDARCRKASSFTFDMVEHMVVRLLKSPAGAEIADRYDWVLVDEYQDVNEMQGTMFKLLSKNDQRLFAVGDVKQSIYGFRQADPSLFLERKDAYPKYDKVHYPSKVVLDANFRSRSGICRFVNTVFGRIMSRELCGMDYLGEDSLDPQARFNPVDRRDVELIIKDGDGAKTTAQHVAEYINNLVKSGITVGRKDNEHVLGYKDIAVLMRSPSTHINEFIDAFAEVGIPVSAEKDGFWASREIMTVCSAVKAVSNPCDDVALLATLMAYPGGFEPDDVAKLRTEVADREAPLYIALCELADKGDSKARFAVEKLSELRRVAASGNICSVLNEVYDWLDIFNTIRFSDESENRRANLFRLLSVASDFQKNTNADLHSFCAFAQRNMESSDDKSAMAPTGADAVRIMSIHKSKGLQFPICIVAECEKKFVLERETATLMHEKLGVAVDYYDMVGHEKHKSLAKKMIETALKTKNIAEEMRLLYVAMTRAEDKLILFANESKPYEKLKDAADRADASAADFRPDPYTVSKNSNYAAWIYMALAFDPNYRGLMSAMREFGNEGIQNLHSDVKVVIGEDDTELVESVKESAEFAADPAMVQRIKDRVEYQYPFDDLLGLSAKSSVSVLSKQEGRPVEFSDTPSFLSGTNLTPAQRGTALHKFMQFCDFAACENGVINEADRLEEMEFITEAERNALDLDALGKFFGSSLYDRIKVADRVIREQRFLSKLPVASIKPELADRFPDESVVIQGAADCVIIEDGGLVILDFKSDKVKNAEELVERYATQLTIYGEVFSEIYGLPVKEKIIYSFKLGREVIV